MLTIEELGKIESVLEREPNKGELAVFEAMWSEHCSYKSSRRWFHLFKDDASYVELGIGEGAGLVNLGDDLLIGLGLESHNHPSAISPYDGAATGVGGIIRDILSQGCRPIAILDSLRFGELESQHSQHLLENVVRGISFYGNCCGIPTVGGEVEFAEPFENNCLVNAMCVGTIAKDKIVRSSASKPGSFLVLYGARTGRDGIHGVSFASKDLSEKSEEERPAVQIGDPLMEKILIDATLELVEKELLNGLQDLGGGGLSCAVSEMTHKGSTGALIRLEDVPLREKNMEVWEILVSESQERMLAVVEPQKLELVKEVLSRYDLTFSVIGEVTDNSHCIVYYKGNKVIDLPVDLIVDGFPEPERKIEKPAYTSNLLEIGFPLTSDLRKDILKLFSSPNIGNKSWIYQQYDQHVQIQTVFSAGNDAAVLRLDNGKYIALSLDCNSFMVYLDPYHGTANSASETMRNITSVGAKPLAFVDCLNFGNPEKPESYWQFVESVKGLGQFSHDFNLPIVGGNVSFYNESQIDGKEERINPSPTIGMLGLIEDPKLLLKNHFQNQDNHIIIIGETDGNLGGSEYLRYNHGILKGSIPLYNKEREETSMKAIQLLNEASYLESCHDLSNGGLIIALAEMTFERNIGVSVTLDKLSNTKKLMNEESLFSESPSRYLIEVIPNNLEEVEQILRKNNVFYSVLGRTQKEPSIEIEKTVLFKIDELRKIWERAISNKMDGKND
ncbi:MAG: phosphoribosylformylglycinamidine synthase subunit PurL [Asgard group archaeon]|nr:phosphoribosylformylglycinamidine synthase subunit PurL [Asgard group archaeon]